MKYGRNMIDCADFLNRRPRISDRKMAAAIEAAVPKAMKPTLYKTVFFVIVSRISLWYKYRKLVSPTKGLFHSPSRKLKRVKAK
ncbi:hypothetical protein D3C85_1647460 [compost metagenome]